MTNKMKLSVIFSEAERIETILNNNHSFFVSMHQCGESKIIAVISPRSDGKVGENFPYSVPAVALYETLSVDTVSDHTLYLSLACHSPNSSGKTWFSLLQRIKFLLPFVFWGLHTMTYVYMPSRSNFSYHARAFISPRLALLITPA